MTTDEAVTKFETFIDELLGKFSPIGKPMYSNEWMQSYAKLATEWDNRLNTEKEQIRKELTEEQFEMFLKLIDETHKTYNQQFIAIISKVVPIQIND